MTVKMDIKRSDDSFSITFWKVLKSTDLFLPLSKNTESHRVSICSCALIRFSNILFSYLVLWLERFLHVPDRHRDLRDVGEDDPDVFSADLSVCVEIVNVEDELAPIVT